MLGAKELRAQIPHALEATRFEGLGKLYQGKVRDNYTHDAALAKGIPKGHMAIVTSDRISAFDVVLGTVPFKGALLNSIAQYWFGQTKDICDNHLVSAPHPNLWLVKECQPIPVEMVVRGYLTGTSPTSAWTAYARGERTFCGNELPEGLRMDEKLAEPIITPSTKAAQGEHDESVAPEVLFQRDLVSPELYEQLADLSMRLYKRGSEMAATQGLIFVDTKYEFGLLDDKIVLIDEVNTPDSSRYWMADTYQERFEAGKGAQKLDKEYVRGWLSGLGFKGDGEPPALTPEVQVEAATRYIKAHDIVTGKAFQGDMGPVADSLEEAIRGEGWL